MHYSAGICSKRDLDTREPLHYKNGSFIESDEEHTVYVPSAEM